MRPCKHFPNKFPAIANRVLVVLTLVCAALLLLPEAALAWGPGVHMVTGNWLLQNLTALPAGVGAAVMQYPALFLQGCLSADIFIGKGCVAKEGHSHNWSTGLSLLEKAHTKRKLAYACGYLSHLAADTVAHNVFVPGAFNTAPGRGFNQGKLAHVYLEIQADNAVPWDRKDALAVFREAGSRGAERMLIKATQQKAWLFWLKKHIFRGSIGIGGRKSWRASMHMLDSALNGERRRAELEALLAVSTRAIVDLLRDPYNSVVRSLDPVGTEALAEAAGNGAVKAGEACCEILAAPACPLPASDGLAGSFEGGHAADAASFPLIELDLPGVGRQSAFNPQELRPLIESPDEALHDEFLAGAIPELPEIIAEVAPDYYKHYNILADSIFALPEALLSLAPVCAAQTFTLPASSVDRRASLREAAEYLPE